MTSLLENLNNIFYTAFIALGLDPKYAVVKIADRPDLAQFQCNAALAIAKKMQQKPQAIAQSIIDLLIDSPGIASLTIAGPGFINIILTDDFLLQTSAEMLLHPKICAKNVGLQRTIILDYGGPNVAKAMHVGHLRSAIIGEALKRIYHFLGFSTVADVHIGDWGTQMGMVISELEKLYPNWPYFTDIKVEYPQKSPVSVEQLAQIYPKVSQECRENPARLELAKTVTLQLQNGHPGYRALWQHIVDVSIRDMQQNYARLNVYFDLWNGESTVHSLIAPMVESLRAKGLARFDAGATVVDITTQAKPIPPLILYKTDGAVMYGTTDLATLVDRAQQYQAAKIIYVVDKRQFLHFEQVFHVARKADIIPFNTELVFIGYGTMNGPDGRPFKTRDGKVMRLEDLIATAIDKAKVKMQHDNAAIMEADAKLINDGIAEKVAISAIKFADLQNHPNSDYIFDLDRMSSFEGKTGPYLLYQVVRIKSLLNKYNQITPTTENYTNIHLNDFERNLCLQLNHFPEILLLVIQHNSPHFLCEHLYKSAQMFSSFYASCNILAEKNERLRELRLLLCKLSLRQLEQGLELLGIETPDRM